MSGLFGSTSKQPAPDPRAFGYQTGRANTNQQARPVPMVYGQRRLGVTFISDIFLVQSFPVTQTIGKKTEQTGTNFFGSFAGLVCHGPVDELDDIFLNGEPVFASSIKLIAVALIAVGTPGNTFYTAVFQTAVAHGLANGATVLVKGADQAEFNGEFTITVISATQFTYQMPPPNTLVATWTQSGAVTAQAKLDPVLRGGGNPDFARITVPDYGVMRIYWGTETQTADPFLNLFSGIEHPAYLGFCYIVWETLYFGFNQTNPQNVELVVTRNPSPTWGDQPNRVRDCANPAYVIADLYQNVRAGLALDDSLLDTAALEAAALQFSTEQLGVGDVLNRAQDLRSILSNLCETVDALPVLNASGFLSLTTIRPPGVDDDVPEIEDSDLADLPQFTPQDWSTAYSTTYATFLNRDLQYQDDSRVWRDMAAIGVARNPDALTLDRHWISWADLAQAIANAGGQAAAIPLIQGKLKLRWDDTLFAQLAPGNVFTMNSSFRDSGELLFRVTARNAPAADQAEFDIEFQADRSYLYTFLLQQAQAEGGSPLDIGSIVPPPPIAVPINTRLRLFELPPALCPQTPALAALVARDSTAITNFSLWLKKNAVWSGAVPDSYETAINFIHFAMHAILVNDYGNDTRLIDLARGALVQLDGPDITLDEITAFEALANEMLVFIDDEILSLAGWTLTGPGTYRLQLVRGRYGTPIQDHAADSDVFLLSRSNLTVLPHNAFRPGNDEVLKVALGQKTILDATELDITLAGTAWRAPSPCALMVNGRFRNAVFPGGATPLTVSWVLPDPGGIFPRFNITKSVTRLQFFVAGILIYQTDVPWPTTSLDIVFRDHNGGVDANFTVTAQTIVDPDWHEVPSADSSSLAALKYP